MPPQSTTEPKSPPVHARPLPALAVRFLIVAGAILAEVLAASVLLDTGDLPSAGGPATWLRLAGPALVRGSALFLATALLLSQAGWHGLRAVFEDEPEPWRWPYLVGHAAAMTLFGALCAKVFTGAASGVAPGWVAAWCAAGTAGVVLMGVAALPPALWRNLAKAVGWGWCWGAGVAAAAVAAGPLARSGWKGTTAATFQVVRFLLSPLLPNLRADAATADIGTPGFTVTIDSACSGYEGVGLFLAFAGAWLYVFRREYRFPGALMLLPAGALLVWLLNAVRIAALILIGNAGAERIALGGFHSEAGWIAFLFSAILFCVLSRRVAWFRRGPAATAEARTDSAVAAYLLPFLAIVAASLVSRAASAGFEWLYPLRLAAAGAALWYFRKSYKGIDWHFGFEAVVAGLAVAAIWVWTTPLAARMGLPEGFAAMPAGLRVLWLAARLAAAVGTVPVAEELAFRGYLLRRMADADFERVSWQNFAWLPLVVSTVAFGMMHESRWLAGMAAGAAYALVQIRRGRMGDAVAAHAVTNAALAALVWITGDWRYW